jgi:hypothetical protein
MVSDHRGNRGDPIDLLSYRDGMAGCPLVSLLIKCAYLYSSVPRRIMEATVK